MGVVHFIMTLVFGIKSIKKISAMKSGSIFIFYANNTYQRVVKKVLDPSGLKHNYFDLGNDGCWHKYSFIDEDKKFGILQPKDSQIQ